MTTSKVRGKRLLAVAGGSFITSMACFVGNQDTIGSIFFLLMLVSLYVGGWQYSKTDDGIPLKWKDRTPQDHKVIIIAISGTISIIVPLVLLTIFPSFEYVFLGAEFVALAIFMAFLILYRYGLILQEKFQD